MHYNVTFNEDFIFSVESKYKTVAAGLTLCQATRLCDEYNYLANIIDIVSEAL